MFAAGPRARNRSGQLPAGSPVGVTTSRPGRRHGPRARSGSSRWSLLAFTVAALAGCGGHPPDSGGGGGGGGGGTPDPAETCTSVQSPAAGYGLGVCASPSSMSTVFVASTTTVAATNSDLKSPQYTLTLDAAAAAGEAASIAFTSADIAGSNRVGALTGLRVSKQIGSTSADGAELTDFRTANQSGSVTTLVNGAYGSWSRYTSSTEGYQGVWYSAITSQGLVKVPTTGTLNLSGYAVGTIGPAGVTVGAKMLALSASLTLSVNFSNGAVTGTLSNFNASSSTGTTASANLVSMPITGTLDLVSRANLSGALVATANGTQAGTGDGVLVGQLIGDGTLSVTEVIGRLRLNTTDNRRVLLAFGAK